MIQKYKIPPFESMFQPTTTVFEDNVTYVEFLTGILCRLNEVIDLVNKHEEFIENYSGIIEQLQADMIQLRSDFQDFQVQIEEEIDTRFDEIKVYLNESIASATSYMRAYTDATAQQLQQAIDNIALGQITVYDPTTGYVVPLQTAIDNLYDSGRQNAISATEYDALELTATAYDALEITAREYDQDGKTILTS